MSVFRISIFALFQNLCSRATFCSLGRWKKEAFTEMNMKSRHKLSFSYLFLHSSWLYCYSTCKCQSEVEVGIEVTFSSICQLKHLQSHFSIIAIVNDAYQSVNAISELVFWDHRFDYLSEVDGLIQIIDKCHAA